MERLRRAIDEGQLLATEVADHLTGRGLPFRQAHDAAGKIVRAAIARGVDLTRLSVAEMREAAGDLPGLDESMLAVLDAGRAVDRRDVTGGPARNRVLAALDEAEQTLRQES